VIKINLITQLIKVSSCLEKDDPCVVPRAVPIVEAMAALVIADYLLIARTNRV